MWYSADIMCLSALYKFCLSHLDSLHSLRGFADAWTPHCTRFQHVGAWHGDSPHQCTQDSSRPAFFDGVRWHSVSSHYGCDGFRYTSRPTPDLGWHSFTLGHFSTINSLTNVNASEHSHLLINARTPLINVCLWTQLDCQQSVPANGYGYDTVWCIKPLFNLLPCKSWGWILNFL